MFLLLVWLVAQDKTRNDHSWADARNGRKIKENGRKIKEPVNSCESREPYTQPDN